MNEIASMNNEIYAKMPNVLFSIKNNKNNYTYEGSILNIIDNDKVINILYELIIGTNFKHECVTSIDYLISCCHYKLDRDNRLLFKNIINKLIEYKYISCDNTIEKSNKLIVINTCKLTKLADNGYTCLTQKEMDILKDISNSNKEFTNLLKLYLFIKMMVRKKSDGSYTDLHFECDTQSIAMDYVYINKFTNISNIHKYIDKLQDNKLIIYGNVGKKYKGDIKNIRESKNVYVVNSICKNAEEELSIALKQYKYVLQQDGWNIVKDYKHNDRVLNGLKGSLIKKLNNGTITEEELKNLNKINDKYNK